MKQQTRAIWERPFHRIVLTSALGKTSRKLDDAGIFSVSNLAKADPKKLAQETQIDNRVLLEYIAQAEDFLKSDQTKVEKL